MSNISPEFALAWLAAKKEMEPVVKKARNLFFKTPEGKPSQYATLASILDEVDPAFQNQGIVLSLPLSTSPDGQYVGASVMLVYSKTGEVFSSSPLFFSPSKKDPQGYLAACTYSQRGALTAFCALPTMDDDGNTASKPPTKVSPGGVTAITTLMKELNITDLAPTLERLKIKPVLVSELTMEDAQKVVADLKVAKAAKG